MIFAVIEAEASPKERMTPVVINTFRHSTIFVQVGEEEAMMTLVLASFTHVDSLSNEDEFALAFEKVVRSSISCTLLLAHACSLQIMFWPKSVLSWSIQIISGLSAPEANRMKSQTLKIPATCALADTYSSKDAFLDIVEEGSLSFDEAVRYYQHDLKCFHLQINSRRLCSLNMNSPDPWRGLNWKKHLLAKMMLLVITRTMP